MIASVSGRVAALGPDGVVVEVGGVGPRLAQAVLAVHPPTEVRRAVATADVPALTRVPGIGRKGAERLVLELRDRIGPVEPTATGLPAAASVTPVAPWGDQVRHALVGLGWTAREAEEAVAAVAPAAGPGEDAPAPDVPSMLRAALRVLGPR